MHVMPMSRSMVIQGRGLVVVLCAAVLLSGCQRMADVSGVVRVGGKPTAGLMVNLEPETKGLPRGVAETDDDGRFTIRRLGVGASTGLPAGRYAVIITANVDHPDARLIPDQVLQATAISHEVVVGGNNILDVDLPAQ
jgi:hypothetical protein